jgi:hypothetical protein
MTAEMELVVDVCGDVRCIYDEALDLREIGRLTITRASHVEPDAEGNWWADMGPVDGPVLGPYGGRSDALEAERHWINRRSKTGHHYRCSALRRYDTPNTISGSCALHDSSFSRHLGVDADLHP